MANHTVDCEVCMDKFIVIAVRAHTMHVVTEEDDKYLFAAYDFSSAANIASDYICAHQEPGDRVDGVFVVKAAYCIKRKD